MIFVRIIEYNINNEKKFTIDINSTKKEYNYEE